MKKLTALVLAAATLAPAASFAHEAGDFYSVQVQLL